MRNITCDPAKRKDIIAYLALILIAAVMISLIYRIGHLYGSETDWVSQHSVFPDYFRNLFYETGKLFPDYAMQVGAGQNIYYLSYYGFLNPVILVSYFFPMVSMVTYLTVTSIVSVIISVCLSYFWLRRQGFSRTVGCVAALCFLLAGPVIFHSHRQLTFVNYFPFLFLGLIGIDRYFKTQREGLFILSVFLMIMTSYFFSVGGIFALLIYAGYQYYESRRIYYLNGFFRQTLPLIKDVAIAFFMAAVLWLPTLYVIANSRGSESSSLSLLSYLIPNFSFALRGLLYGTYTLGLSFITLIALIVMIFSKKKHEKVLTLILCALLIFPIFSYLLNGTLYARAKALIPFLPLYILITAIFLRKFIGFCETRLKRRWGKISVTAVILLILIPSALICWYVNTGGQTSSLEQHLVSEVEEGNHATFLHILEKTGDQLVPIEEYQDVHSADKLALIEEILAKDTSFYRMNDLTNSGVTCNQVYASGYAQTSIYSSTYNKWYNAFYYDEIHNAVGTRNRLECASSQNIFFQNFMDIKYLITKTADEVPTGYVEIARKGDYVLSENENTLPFAYASGNIISQTDYSNLAFPYNLSAFFDHIIVDSDQKSQSATTNSSGFHIQKLDLTSETLVAENQTNVTISQADGDLQIEAQENASLKLPLNIDLQDQVLIIRFTVSNRENQEDSDTMITINGVKNKLSKQTAEYPNQNYHFVYILSANESTKQLNLEFSAGKYKISSIEAYTMPASEIESAITQVDPFVVDANNVSDDEITGDINVTKDGYFATTLPYDKGYSILVDGKKQSYEMVNTAFVGFPITKGNHHIVITYHAPYKKIGLILSAIGFALFVITLIIGAKRRRNHIVKLQRDVKKRP